MVWDRTNRPIWLRYTASVIAVAIAAAAGWRLPGANNFNTSFVTFYPAAAIAALYGGLGPGLLATISSALLADFFWMPPAGSLAIANTGDMTDMVLFLAGSILVSCLIEMLYRSQETAHKAQQELRLAAEREKTEEERKKLIQARLNLIEYANAHTMEELLERALDEVGSIVESPAGFFCLVGPGTETISLKQWSIPTGKEFCGTEGKSRPCGVDPAGLCAECARAGKPVIHNDYGLGGENSAMVGGGGGTFRCLAVPVMREGNIVAFLGMGDKPLDYTDRDAETVVYLADVTWEIIERKLAAEKTAKLAAIVQASEEAVIGINPKGIITSWNRGAENIYGYTESEVIGKPANILLPNGYENDWSQILAKITSGESIVHYETDGRTKEGGHLFMSLTISPVRDREGKILEISAIGRDITERKRSEQEKEKLSSRLRQAQKLEAIGTLAGGIAHDFNNILQPIVGYTEMALSEVSASDPLRSGLEQVLKASLRAKELVKQILSVSNARLGQQRTATEVGAVVEEAMKLLRSVLPASIEIRENIGKGVALAEATQIHQVLMNLCTNAAHAMDNRGILEVALTNVTLGRTDCADPTLYRLESGPYLKLCVSDTGAGIDKETLERIFDPYFTTKGVGKGSGLGLAIVKGIVERHEGAITVESEPGKGARFTIYIPCIDVESQKDVEVDSPLQQGSERILLVDDEPEVVTVGARLLELLGYSVTSFTDSVEALEAFGSNPDKFDLVISDFTMPGLTGLDLAAEVLRLRPGTPILLCTGFSEKIDLEDFQEIGVEILMKPYSIRQISEAVRKTLEGREES